MGFHTIAFLALGWLIGLSLVLGVITPYQDGHSGPEVAMLGIGILGYWAYLVWRYVLKGE